MKKGTIFNIQRFCTEDGPGIRTTVFLKGCPLRCRWCHNPESQMAYPQLMYNSSLCIACGACVDVCNKKAHIISESKHLFFRDRCILCAKCSDECPSTALEISGREQTVSEVMATVFCDIELYKKTGGGITLSGGEPLFQSEFSYEILKAAKNAGIHTCIETCGYGKQDDLIRLADVTDLFLYDWKVTDELIHKKYTGVSNRIIKDNIFALDKIGAKIILRCPIIPTVNDTDQHFSGIAELVNNLKNVVAIDIEPYHTLGLHKQKMLGEISDENLFPVPDRQCVEHYIEKVAQETQIPVRKL